MPIILQNNQWKQTTFRKRSADHAAVRSNDQQ